MLFYALHNLNIMQLFALCSTKCLFHFNIITWKMGMVTNYKTTYPLASWGTSFNHIKYILAFLKKSEVYCRNVTRVKQGLSLATTNPDDL